MKQLKIGDKIAFRGIKGVIIQNPKYQRNIMVKFEEGILIIKRKQIQ